MNTKKVIIVTSLFLATLFQGKLNAQWSSSTTPTPVVLPVTQDAGIGTSTPDARLEIVSREIENNADGAATLTKDKNHLLLTFERWGSNSIISGGSFRAPTFQYQVSWEIDNRDGELNFNFLDQNYNPTTYLSMTNSQFTINNDVQVNHDLTVSGNSNLNNAQINGNLVINNGFLLIKGTNSNTVGDSEIKLGSNGYIRAREIKVDYDNIPDYVFKPNYKLMPLNELDKFINLNKHLPNIKGESEYSKEEGLNVGELNLKLLEKIEELTLYVIELKKEIDTIKSK